MKKCPYCAEDIQDAAIVCKHCGRDLKAGVSQVQIVQPPAKTSPAAMGCLGLIVFVVLIVIIGQCNSPSTSQSTAVVEDAESTWNEQLRTAITGVGDTCPGPVRRTFHQFVAKGEPPHRGTWNVECADGSSYSVQVMDGETKVLSCQMMKMVKVECFKEYSGK